MPVSQFFVRTNLVKRSIPADAGTGFGKEFLSSFEAVRIREMSSEVVEEEEEVMTSHRDRMAAMGAGVSIEDRK